MRTLALVTVVALFVGRSTAADTPIPDWGKFATVGEVHGTIVKSDGLSITVSVPKVVAGKARPGSRKKKAAPKVSHENIEYKYAPEGLVRHQAQPKMADAAGNLVPVTGKALEQAQLPIGAPGFGADRTELRAGHIVTVKLVRPADLAASKVTPGDLSIKYVMIEGETKAPASGEKKKK